MKKREIIWITIIIVALIILVIISGVYYFNLVLTNSVTGHTISEKNPKNACKKKNERVLSIVFL